METVRTHSLLSNVRKSSPATVMQPLVGCHIRIQFTVMNKREYEALITIINDKMDVTS